MQLKNVYEAIDALAPFALSGEYCDTYGFRDNSGVMLDCGGSVRGILCSLDLSARAVEEAKNRGRTSSSPIIPPFFILFTACATARP